MVNLHLDASGSWSTAKDWARGNTSTAKPVDTGGIQVKKTRHEESRHEREPCRISDEADAETENRAAREHHGLRVCGTVFEASRSTWYEIGETFDEREREAREVGADTAK